MRIEQLPIAPNSTDQTTEPTRALRARPEDHVLDGDGGRRWEQLPAVLNSVDALLAVQEQDQTGPAEKPRKLLPPLKAGERPDVRFMSPREMQDYSQDLYAAGIVTFDDYEALAFQPELHPNYDKTIGALTGKNAEPDRPRDFVKHWQDRLDFARRHYPQNSDPVRQANRILDAITSFPRRADIFA